MKSKLMKARERLRKVQGKLSVVKQAVKDCGVAVNTLTESDGPNHYDAYKGMYTKVKAIVGKPPTPWNTIKMGRKVVHPEQGEAQFVVSQGDNKISVVQKGSAQILNWVASECKLKK